MTDPYPIAANGQAVNVADIRAYMDAIFRHVDWSEGGLISILGIGEKGTRQEGKFRGDRKFIDPRGAQMIEIMAGHAKRWAEHEIATFIVPAVVHAASQLSNDVTLDKIKAFPALVVDLDKRDPTAGLEHLERHIGPATLIVRSGGVTEEGDAKLHAYWRLTEPSTEVDRIAALRKLMAEKVGGDQAFGRATQVIRLPGSVHCKNGLARPVSIVRVSDVECELG